MFPFRPLFVRSLLLVSLMVTDAWATCDTGNGGTVCRSNGAPAASLVSGVQSVPAGALELPVGISKYWFTRASSPCGSDASGDISHHIRLFPIGPQGGETATNAQGCAGWHTFNETPASLNRLGTILGGLAAGTYSSPSTEAGSTYFNFVGFSPYSSFNQFLSLFRARRDASGTWTVLLPVYDGSDCSNPSGSVQVVGFATARIYNASSSLKTIDANVDCHVIDVGTLPAPASGASRNFGTQLASPGYCDVAEYCDGATTTCPADTMRPAGTACSDDGNACTTDLCDESGSCLHSAGNAGVICRAAAGACDVAENCDGVGTACPVDAFAERNSSCTDDSDRCTDDLCDGESNCTHPPIPLAPACYWTVVGGSDSTTCAVRTRRESEVDGGICADTADIGDSSSLLAPGSWALLEDSAVAARVRPGATLLGGSVATGGGCISGLQGSPVFGTASETICCNDGKVPLPGGGPDNIIDACGFHPLINRCIQDKVQAGADAALLDLLPATQDLGTMLIEADRSQTLVLGSGLNVVDVTRLTINDGGTLRIDAPDDPDAVLVLRMAHGMRTRTAAWIELDGQAQASRVLFYASRGDCDIGQHNHGAGTIFCPEGKVRMMVQSSWTGAVAAGSAIDIGWGVHLTHEPFLGLAR